jgi:hypothetical protein
VAVDQLFADGMIRMDEPAEARRRAIIADEICRAAELMVDRHDADALTMAARMAEAFRERDDRQSELVWQRIRLAIEALCTASGEVAD